MVEHTASSLELDSQLCSSVEIAPVESSAEIEYTCAPRPQELHAEQRDTRQAEICQAQDTLEAALAVETLREPEIGPKADVVTALAPNQKEATGKNDECGNDLHEKFRTESSSQIDRCHETKVLLEPDMQIEHLNSSGAPAQVLLPCKTQELDVTACVETRSLTTAEASQSDAGVETTSQDNGKDDNDSESAEYQPFSDEEGATKGSDEARAEAAIRDQEEKLAALEAALAPFAEQLPSSSEAQAPSLTGQASSVEQALSVEQAQDCSKKDHEPKDAEVADAEQAADKSTNHKEDAEHIDVSDGIKGASEEVLASQATDIKDRTGDGSTTLLSGAHSEQTFAEQHPSADSIDEQPAKVEKLFHASQVAEKGADGRRAAAQSAQKRAEVEEGSKKGGTRRQSKEAPQKSDKDSLKQRGKERERSSRRSSSRPRKVSRSRRRSREVRRRARSKSRSARRRSHSRGRKATKSRHSPSPKRRSPAKVKVRRKREASSSSLPHARRRVSRRSASRSERRRKSVSKAKPKQTRRVSPSPRRKRVSKRPASSSTSSSPPIRKVRALSSASSNPPRRKAAPKPVPKKKAASALPSKKVVPARDSSSSSATSSTSSSTSAVPKTKAAPSKTAVKPKAAPKKKTPEPKPRAASPASTAAQEKPKKKAPEISNTAVNGASSPSKRTKPTKPADQKVATEADAATQVSEPANVTAKVIAKKPKKTKKVETAVPPDALQDLPPTTSTTSVVTPADTRPSSPLAKTRKADKGTATQATAEVSNGHPPPKSQMLIGGEKLSASTKPVVEDGNDSDIEIIGADIVCSSAALAKRAARKAPVRKRAPEEVLAAALIEVLVPRSSCERRGGAGDMSATEAALLRRQRLRRQLAESTQDWAMPVDVTEPAPPEVHDDDDLAHRGRRGLAPLDKQALEEKLKATQKQILELQMGLKARQLEQLKHRAKRGSMQTFKRFVAAARTPQSRATVPSMSSDAVTPVRAAARTRPLQQTPPSQKSTPSPRTLTPHGSSSQPAKGPELRNALHTAYERQKAEVEKQKALLQAAIERRKHAAASSNGAGAQGTISR